MRIRQAEAADAAHLARFINMAADDLPLHFWKKSVGPEGDPWAWGQERAARESGNFSYRNAWLAEDQGAVAACLLGYPADPEPAAIDPDTPPIFVPTPTPTVDLGLLNVPDVTVEPPQTSLSTPEVTLEVTAEATAAP